MLDAREIYYVYEHINDDGQCFYVGKGTRKRAWSLTRSAYWHRYKSKYCRFGVKVFIVADELDEATAYTLEKEHIQMLEERGVRLVNLAAGGLGGSGRDTIESRAMRQAKGQKLSGLKCHLADQNVYEFVNQVTKEKFVGKRAEFQAQYGFPLDSLFYKKKHRICRNWTLGDYLAPLKERTEGNDKTVYNFVNNKGEEFVGTRFDFNSKYSVDIKDIFRKTRRSLTKNGWTLKERLIENPNVFRIKDAKESFIKLYNKDGRVFEGSRSEFQEQFKIKTSQFFSKNQHGNPALQIKGWALSLDNFKERIHPNRHLEIYKFRHEGGEVFEGTKIDFARHTGILHVYQLFQKNNPSKTVVGWELDMKINEVTHNG